MKVHRLLSGLLFLCLLAYSSAQDDVFTLAGEGSFYDIVLGVSSDADFDVADAYGQTPLMYAASSNTPDVVKLLIDHGVEVNAQSLAGWTPLMYTARDASDPEMVLVLLEGGADPRATQRGGAERPRLRQQQPSSDQHGSAGAARRTCPSSLSPIYIC